MGNNQKISVLYGVLTVLTLFFSPFYAQNNMLVAHGELHQMPVSFGKITDKQNCYIQQGLYHLSELQFLGDSSEFFFQKILFGDIKHALMDGNAIYIE